MVRNFEAHTFTVWCFEKFRVTTFTNQGSVPVATDIKEAFLDLNFHSSWAIRENHKHCKPRKFFAIQYPPCVAYLCQLCQVNESTETLGLLQLDYTQHCSILHHTVKQTQWFDNDSLDKNKSTLDRDHNRVCYPTCSNN